MLNFDMLLGLFTNNGEWFWVMCQFIAVTTTLFLILRQLRFQRNSHLVNSLSTLDTRWKSNLMLQARRLACERYRPDQTTIDQATTFVSLFFEELGMYYRRKTLDIEAIWEVYSYDIECYWIIAKNSIFNFRKQHNDPTIFTNFQGLYESIQKVNKKKGAPVGERTAQDVKEFIEWELENIQFIENIRTSLVAEETLVPPPLNTRES